MRITLTTLGLKDDASSVEIIAALGAREFYTQAEVTEAKNAAATGARKTAEAKAKEAAKKNGTLSEEEMKAYKKYKSSQVLDGLRKNKTLAKFDDEDFKLIVKAERLDDLEGDELATKIKEVSKTYAKRMKNGLTKKVVTDDPTKTKTTETKPVEPAAVTEGYTPGDLGLFVDEKED